jgi:hypothetical protein
MRCEQNLADITVRTYQSGEDLKNASENNIILQMGAKSWSSLLKTSLY